MTTSPDSSSQQQAIANGWTPPPGPGNEQVAAYAKYFTTTADPKVAKSGTAGVAVKQATKTAPITWSGSLSDPDGIYAFMEAELAQESGGNYTSQDNGSEGAQGGYQTIPSTFAYWLQIAINQNPANAATLQTYVNDLPATVPGPVQDLVAYTAFTNMFQSLSSWMLVAESWFDSGGFNTNAAALIAIQNTSPGNNNGLTIAGYGQQVVSRMKAYAKATTFPAGGGNQVPDTANNINTPMGAIGTTTNASVIYTPEPVLNGKPIQPSYPLNLDYLAFRGVLVTDFTLAPLGETTIRDLITTCQVDMTSSELSTCTITLTQGDIVLAALGLGIGAVGTPVEVDFCDSKGNIKWPLAISQVAMSQNEAQQPVVQLTCTSLLLQSWMGVFPYPGDATSNSTTPQTVQPNTSSTAWLMNWAYKTLGKTQWPDGRWVFAGQRDSLGDPNFIIQVADFDSGTMESTVYSVAQAVQQSQGFYLFDGGGTTWFGSPQWIVERTQHVFIQYVPAGGVPLDGTVGPFYWISPVGPPQLGETIQTTPHAFGEVETLNVVRTVTVQLPQYMAAQILPGMGVTLQGTGPQYDNPPALGQLPPIAPGFPYIVTEVTGAVDGGLSTWNVTFQEAVLPSQVQVPGGVAGTVPGGTFGYTGTIPLAKLVGSLKNGFTGTTLPVPSGGPDDATGGVSAVASLPQKLASDFCTYALYYAGSSVQYAYGGGHGTPGFIGLDCSGLVCTCANLVGLNLGGTDAAALCSGCKPISLQAALNTPGALLFMNNPSDGSGINHVAISVGNGYLVAASYPNAFGPGVGVGLYPAQYSAQAGGVIDAGNPAPDVLAGGGNLVFTQAGLLSPQGMIYDEGINGVGPMQTGTFLTDQTGATFGPPLPKSPDSK